MITNNNISRIQCAISLLLVGITCLSVAFSGILSSSSLISFALLMISIAWVGACNCSVQPRAFMHEALTARGPRNDATREMQTAKIHPATDRHAA